MCSWRKGGAERNALGRSRGGYSTKINARTNAEGLPIGIGSSAEWDTRLDGAIAGATMAIPGVKGVEAGPAQGGPLGRVGAGPQLVEQDQALGVGGF